jgi:hypothetical protein
MYTEVSLFDAGRDINALWRHSLHADLLSRKGRAILSLAHRRRFADIKTPLS